MTLSWTDGNTMLPVNSNLISSMKEQNILGTNEYYDGRSLAGQRRKLARMKGTKVMIELIKRAISASLKADYVLFDTWFSAPAQLIAIKALGLDAIAMIRKSSMVKYIYGGKRMSISKIFGICKKRRGMSKYFLSVNVLVEKDGVQVPAKIVCVRNKKKKKDSRMGSLSNSNISLFTDSGYNAGVRFIYNERSYNKHF